MVVIPYRGIIQTPPSSKAADACKSRKRETGVNSHQQPANLQVRPVLLDDLLELDMATQRQGQHSDDAGALWTSPFVPGAEVGRTQLSAGLRPRNDEVLARTARRKTLQVDQHLVPQIFRDQLSRTAPQA